MVNKVLRRGSGVVNVAVAVWHEHQDIRKTHVPQVCIDVTSVECLGNGLVDPTQRDYNCGFRRSKGFRRDSIEGTVLVNRMPSRTARIADWLRTCTGA